MKLTYAIVLILAIFAVSAASQTKLTENTLVLATDQKSAPATINDLSWLAGTWHGNGLGAFAEEMYSQPNGGAMMGAFRMIANGKTVFYEMIIVFEENGTLVYRLKHFNPDLTGWEEKDKWVDFKFVKKDGRRWYFEGLTMEPLTKSKLNIYVAIRQKDGTHKEELFRYVRK